MRFLGDFFNNPRWLSAKPSSDDKHDDNFLRKLKNMVPYSVCTVEHRKVPVFPLAGQGSGNDKNALKHGKWIGIPVTPTKENN
jgi:hypothetical protein